MKFKLLSITLVIFFSTVSHAQFNGLKDIISNVQKAVQPLAPASSNQRASQTEGKQSNAQIVTVLSSDKTNEVQTSNADINLGAYSKGENATIVLKRKQPTIQFELSLGHLKNKTACIEGYVDCVPIDGELQKFSNNTYVYHDELLDCKFTVKFYDEKIKISDWTGFCGTGSANKYRLGLLEGEYKYSKSPPNLLVRPDEKQMAGQINYLKGTIKAFEGAGCAYYKREDEKKKNPKEIAIDDYEGKGIIVNLDGVDTLFKALVRDPKKFVGEVSNNTITITTKESKSCGEECSKSYESIEIKGVTTKSNVIQAFSICGS